MSVIIQQYHKYKAKIKVKDRSSLKPDAVLTDGEVIQTEALWIIDHGPYKNQFATSLPRHTGYVWLPEEDLTILEEI